MTDLRLSRIYSSILALAVAGCGTVVGNPKKPSSGGGTTTPTTSVVDDTGAQAQAVSLQINGVVAALSDGTTAGEAISSYGLVDPAAGSDGLTPGLAVRDDTKFSERRVCTSAPISAAVTLQGADGNSWQVAATTYSAKITRTLSGKLGSKGYDANPDGTASTVTEQWYPGPYFGLANAKGVAGTNAAVMAPTGSTAPAIPAAAAGAAAGSSGALGSVGWRSQDGSWTGVPAWEVGPGYQGDGGVPVSQTEGMVMYFTANMPAVTPVSSAGKVGGTYAPLAMLTRLGKSSAYSVLGQRGPSALPSFQTTGEAFIGGADVAVEQAGQITTPALPAVIYNPPAVIGCADNANVGPGFRFSQNVAELTRLTTTNTTFNLAYRNGASSNQVSGNTVTTWSDPALVAPVAATPSAPYYDENAGQMTLTRNVTIGTQAAPNTTTSTFTGSDGTVYESTTNATYTASPIVDVLSRDLNNGSVWKSRTVHSGTVVSSHAAGSDSPSATISTSFKDVVFTNSGDPVASCIPASGVIAAVIQPVDATKQTTTITVKFGKSVGVASASGVTVTVTCGGGDGSAANCTAVGEADNPDYRPSGCNF